MYGRFALALSIGMLAGALVFLANGCSGQQQTNLWATVCSPDGQTQLVSQIPTGMISPAQATEGIKLLCGITAAPSPTPASSPAVPLTLPPTKLQQ